jgi:hypothetical protein
MKRNLIFTIWILLFFGFFLVNCSAQSSTNDQRIVGTWICDVEGTTYTVVFNANGSGSYSIGSENTTFTYLLSVGGEMISNARYIGGKIYYSPDGRTLAIEQFGTRNFFRKK